MRTFVFIDASHLYEQTKADIRLWYRKVKDEGILAGHDLNQEPVGRAVREVIPYVITRDPIPNAPIATTSNIKYSLY